MTAHNSVNKI